VRPEDIAKDTPHGPDLERYVEAIREATDAGFDHLVLHQIGPDQAGFMRFFEKELRAALKDRVQASGRKKSTGSARSA
jgi:hypothetical protein